MQSSVQVRAGLRGGFYTPGSNSNSIDQNREAITWRTTATSWPLVSHRIIPSKNPSRQLTTTDGAIITATSRRAGHRGGLVLQRGSRFEGSSAADSSPGQRGAGQGSRQAFKDEAQRHTDAKVSFSGIFFFFFFFETDWGMSLNQPMDARREARRVVNGILTIELHRFKNERVSRMSSALNELSRVYASEAQALLDMW